MRIKLPPVLKAMVGAGFVFNEDWVARPATNKTNLNAYWEGAIATIPGSTIPSQTGWDVYNRLCDPKNMQECIAQVDASDYTFKYSDSVWTITGLRGSWEVEAKLTLNEPALHHLLNLLVAFVPTGKSVSLQADSHQAGDCWVGLVCCYDQTRIPFMPISADIGCGMCILPMLKDGRHLNALPADTLQGDMLHISPQELEVLKVRVMMTARVALQRGKAVENGHATVSLVDEVLQFLDKRDEKEIWVDNLRRLFLDLEIAVPDDDVVGFVMGFGMTLGSSGNHFLEMNQAEDGRLYLVIHSGSRALGAMVYKRISAICCALYGVNAVAVGEYAALYNLAYSALNNFAIINRLLCGVRVLQELGCTFEGESLKQHMVNHTPLFAGIADQPQQVSALLRGVTHNGIKCFLNHTTRQKIFIMCKGAIAISSRASCGIVALRAGEGVVVMVFLNPDAQWVECDLLDVHQYEHYAVIQEIAQTDILLMGHGAGRSGSTTSTWKKSEYSMVLEFYRERGIVGGLSPGILGDNPTIAYKSVEEVRRHLPEDSAHAVGWLHTLVNHKEGIDNNPRVWKKFVEFVQGSWDNLSELEKLMCDLILVKSRMKYDDTWDQKMKEQEQIYEKFCCERT